ncbi:MAG: alpha-galactosidase [Erysipelotrichaceae bacterium]|nr:alpha-galactosidase [Erysipelotrichaceae bacterium]
MSITFISEHNVFKLDGKDYTYLIGVYDNRYLLTLYYGKKIEIVDPSRLMVTRELGFSPSPHEDFYRRDRSLDTMLQECPTFGYGDFRIPSIMIEQENGSRCLDLRYKSYEFLSDKPLISQMPSLKEDDHCDSLKITLKDEVSGVEVDLFYNVYQNRNVLTRHLKIRNTGKEKLIISKAMSCSFDLRDNQFDLLQLIGTHCEERHIEVTPLRHGISKIESRRCTSSHMLNPFMALCRKDVNEYNGEVYGINLVYSGNYEGTIEVDQRHTTRVQMGIGSFDFAWPLMANEVFETPEVVMVYSPNGLNAMSQTFHDLYNDCLLKKHYHHPIVVNNWEATYFDFNEEKLTKLIESAKGLGIETFVLDDGWFAKRNNDESSLGDWVVNTQKLPNGLEKIADICKKNKLGFGLWFEPEMISEESSLYKNHPEYAIRISNRPHLYSRCQLVLDLSKKEVCDYIIKAISDVVDNLPITYIKWDFNRNITETQNKQLCHKYVLGLYYVLDAITSKYPNIMIEGCSGGGGRFDPAMLYYTPQIWTSDDTDAIERLYIQYGTSIVYPPTSMVGHVSVTPNHQTGRVTPFKTRGIVAMSANFGYELNPQVLSEAEQEMVKAQTKEYQHLRKVIYNSSFYRLRSPYKGNDCAWSFVSKNKKEVYVMYVRILNAATNEFDYLLLKGLDEKKIYLDVANNVKYTGSELMNVGLLLPRHPYDFNGIMYHFKEVRE